MSGRVGYTKEYPVEQYMRDSKVLTIWEGNSFIHGNDLVGRKMTMDNGEPFKKWMGSIRLSTHVLIISVRNAIHMYGVQNNSFISWLQSSLNISVAV